MRAIIQGREYMVEYDDQGRVWFCLENIRHPQSPAIPVFGPTSQHTRNPHNDPYIAKALKILGKRDPANQP